MSSYLNKQAPPPPPPKATTVPPPPSSTLPTDAASTPTRIKPSHRHKQSIHYNDAPDFASLGVDPAAGGGGGQGGLNRNRSARASRVPALQSIPATSATQTSSRSTTPLTNARGLGGGDDVALPAFNAPPPPPPDAVASIRTGPRLLPYDILHYSAPSLTVKYVVVFVPGNPGLVDYYRSFLSRLQASLPPAIKESTDLYAIGHLGHSLQGEQDGMTRGFKPDQQATLHEQVESKVEFVDELKGKYGDDVKIIMMGHSIGSWICLQVLNQRPSVVSSAHLLFPTISSMSSTPNGRRLSPLFSSWSLRPLFLSTSFLSYLPKSLTSSMVSLLTGQSGPGSAVTNRLVNSPQTVVAAITMAQKEMVIVTQLDRDVLERHGDKLWWYWAEEGNDGWVLEESIREIEEVLGDADERKKRRERCREGMPHAFVLNEDHTTSLASKCAGWIVEDLESAQST
ncbi:hypothetical protein JCM10212_002812 [Sporobolomyces blumeae]